MVQLLQLVLQLYAARQLATGETEGVEGAVNKVRGCVAGCKHQPELNQTKPT